MLVSAAVAALAFLGGADRARAGAYEVHECWHPVGSLWGVPDVQWNSNASVYAASQGCSPPEATARLTVFNVAAIGTYAYGLAYLAAPAGTYFASGSFKVNLADDANHIPYVAICAPGACTNVQLPNIPEGAWTQVSAGYHTSLNAYLYCPSACPYRDEGRVHTWLQMLRFQIADVSSPQIGNLAGSMLNDPARGTVRLTVPATDAGGGLTRLSARVNGTPLGDQVICNPGSSVNSFRPCPGAMTFQVSSNTEDPPWREGSNAVQVCAYDFANSGATSPNETCRSFTVNVDNSCTRSSSATAATALSARLDSEEGMSGGQIEVRSSDDVFVEGTVSGPGGPLGGALICVYERVNVESATRSVVKTGHSRPDGTFRIDLGQGPSRLIDVATRSNNTQVGQEGLRVDSVAVPLLKVADRSIRNGKSGRFKGLIPGPYADGRAVTLQARAGKKWRTFKQLKTKEGGRFKAKYPFRHTTGTVVYKFRALIKEQAGYPYLRGHSKKKRIRVRG